MIKAIWLAAEQSAESPEASAEEWMPHYEKRRGRLAAGCGKE